MLSSLLVDGCMISIRLSMVGAVFAIVKYQVYLECCVRMKGVAPVAFDGVSCYSRVVVTFRFVSFVLI